MRIWQVWHVKLSLSALSKYKDISFIALRVFIIPLMLHRQVSGEASISDVQHVAMQLLEQVEHTCLHLHCRHISTDSLLDMLLLA